TLLKVTQSAAGFQLEVSYQQEGNAAILPTYTIGNIEVVKSPFYPLISVVSIPTAKFGGFSVQIDLPTGRAQFDPYPGLGGVSGPIECRFTDWANPK
ncbi:MAG: hypothetical protein H7333_09320, partial [Bdellovibrionales bacterium]|nr:hypothetical protein [Oligoflexia bacterium]